MKANKIVTFAVEKDERHTLPFLVAMLFLGCLNVLRNECFGIVAKLAIRIVSEEGREC